MLKKLHNMIDIAIGLKDDQSNIEATTPEKVALYSMYSSVSLISVLMLIITF